MVSCKVDMAKVKKLLRRVPQETERIMQKAVQVDAKGFVRDIVNITPPSMGRADKASQKRGEMAIVRDLLGIRGEGQRRNNAVFIVISDEVLAKATPKENYVRLFATKDGSIFGVETDLYHPNASTAEMHIWHLSNRDRGKITSSGSATRDDGRLKIFQRMVVSVTAFDRYKKFIFKEVGMLAGGFNDAAIKLGVSLPSWIKRHGTSRGVCQIKTGPNSFSIEIRNSVKYASANDLKRRMVYVLQSNKRKARIWHAVRAEVRAVLKNR